MESTMCPQVAGITKPYRTKPRQRHQRHQVHRDRDMMQSTHFYQFHAAPDAVAGATYYRQPDNINTQLPLGVPVRPASGTSIVPIQVSGNMLGARARAAEYNAAKAATARQQASQEAEGQKIPRPPPTPLSAFARNASSSRNKGIKSFIPLVLTEEEGSLSSTGQENEDPDSPSPSPKPSEPSRAASLPPPQTAVNTRSEPNRNVKTPHRFHDSQYIPFAPRAMLIDDGGYFYTQHALPHMQQYMHYHPAYPTLPQPPQVLSAPHIGLPPTTPVPEPRPQLQRERDSDESAPAEPVQTQSSNTSPSISKHGLALDGQTRYSFGPDDLSPAKCELKTQARMKAFQEQKETSARARLEDSITEAELAEPPHRPQSEQELLRLLKESSMSLQRKLSDDSHASAAEQKHSDAVEPRVNTQADRRSRLVRKASAPLVPTEADWPYLGDSSTYYGGSNDAPNSGLKSAADVKVDEASDRLKHILLDGLKQKAEADAAASAMKPPPGLPRPKPQRVQTKDPFTDQITSLKFPLVDLDSKEWLDIQPLSERKRYQMRRVLETVRTCPISDKYRDTWEDRGELPKPEFHQHLENSKQDFLEGRQRLRALTEEMHRKWEYGDASQSITLDSIQVKKRVGTVEAVGTILSALNIQLEDKTGSEYRGSRPYSAAPAYAIRRGVDQDKQAKHDSLFESHENMEKPVPPRLARDPRFRPQLGDAIKVDGARIPRMFVSKRP